MPKEPFHTRPFAGSAPAAPYMKPSNSLVASGPQSSSAVSTVARAVTAGGAGGESTAPSSSSAPTSHRAARLTINNFASFRARVKKLPPDANTKAALHTQLYQFPERVCFGCVKCRRDNVESDSVAIDLKNRITLCTACFTRIIRPRTYAPSRVVPFPSLLSWLNYKPSHVMEMSDDVLERPAEAVAPSGERMAAPMLASGDRASHLGKLPAIAMNIAASGGRGRGAVAGGRRSGPTIDDALAQGAAGAPTGTHPCLRVWGVCQHGETCLFRNAPADLCLAYLMGLCGGRDHPIASAAPGGGGGGGGGGVGRPKSNTVNHGGRHGRGGAHHNRNQGGRGHQRDHGGGAAAAPAPAGGVGSGQTCRLLHQDVYDLPDLSDPRPRERFEGDLEDEEGVWAAWVRRRRDSPNSAEWQLWHNGPLEQLFRMYVPARRRPVVRQAAKRPEPADARPVAAAAVVAAVESAEAEDRLVDPEPEAAPPDAEDDPVDGGEEEEGQSEDAAEDEAGGDEGGGEEGGGGSDGAEEESAPAPAPSPSTKLNLMDIMSALKGLKKDTP
ncbi:hypothetical protein NESM_000697900 [Novymonas esmeraldas]|uniref:Uncharacterized protein n=1 Tax=Novymonas esmeraldas TaxID=1808958 RepID=A0AAW0EUU9_9TRYP